MTTTPSRFKLSCKSRTEKREKDTSNDHKPVMSTPHKKNVPDSEGESSPVFFQLTQESNEDIDVLWDWHSPQTSQRRKRKQKRILVNQSPKFPVKRYPPKNHNHNFEKLRNELKALQEELAVPDDESCLCVSPQQEHEYKAGEGNNLDIVEADYHCDDDLFNDSIDDQLVAFSQNEEEKVTETEQTRKSNEENNLFGQSFCDDSEIDKLINKYNEKNLGDFRDNLLNSRLNTFQNEISHNTPKHSKVPFQRTASDGHFNSVSNNVIQTASGKLEFHRTKSFEIDRLSGQNNAPKSLIEEIEKKRLEAKAKLEAKKKKENMLTLSQSKCSPEEIEKKRLQALAKLETRRLQELVEKKRQEALKKLQLSRMKNASQVKKVL